jgi:hypothetical protein
MLEKPCLAKVVAMGLVVIAASCSSSTSTDTPGSSPDGGSQAPESDASGAGGASSLEGSATESSGAPAPDYASGSRIHAVLFVSGSAKLFKTWHDTQLDTDCAFGLAEDGKVRCVPTVSLTTSYSDAGCTKPLLNATPCNGTPKFVGIGSSIGCPTQGPAIYRLGPKLAAAPAMAYQMKDTACTAVMQSGDGDFYEGIAKVDAQTLVEGTTTREKRSSALSVDVLRGADGSIETQGIVQTPAGYDCSLYLPFIDIPQRCWPQNVAYQEVFFSDSACQTSVAFKPGYGTYCSENPSSVEVEPSTPPKCISQAVPAFAEIGAKSPGSVYRKDGAQGMCMANPPVEPSSTFWTIGAAIPTTSFAELATKEEGTGPVLVRAITAATGERLRSGVFFDTARKATCRPERAGDGQLRCLPFTDGGSQAYSFTDEMCKEPILALGSGCTAPSIVETDLPDPTSCAGFTRFYNVGQRSTASVIYTHNGDMCQMTGAPLPDTDYYATTGEIPPSTFPAITTTVE